MMVRNATYPPALAQRPSRAPNGARTQVGVRLTDPEREWLERVASQEVRSVSAMARLLILDALHRRAEETRSAE
nr:hypothetical protein 7 [Saccharospirillaceae bacterium]